MSRREYGTPRGMHDLLYARSAMLRRVERELTRLYALRGYREVMTPLLEFYEVFNGQDHGDIFKLIDGGNILAIRPDSTAPICRLVATKLADSPLPLRLYYSQDIMGLHNGHSGARTQVKQSGVELIGADGPRADVEIAQTAIAALEAAGLSDFKLELGHAGIFGALAEKIDFCDEDAELVRSLIEEKNHPALVDALCAYESSHRSECEALCRLPRLFGGPEVFGEADAVIKNEEAARQVAYLKLVYEKLAELGLGDRIVLDLGLVNRMEYYTGVIIGAYAAGSGERVLSGGRYGTLYKKYGMSMSATGFAVNMDAVCDALERTSGVENPEPPEVLIYYSDGHEKSAFDAAETLRKDGVCAEMSDSDDFDEALLCAGAKGVKKLLSFDGGGRREIDLT